MVITHEKTALPLAENTAKVTGIRCPSQRTCCQRGVMQLVLKERAPRPCRSQVDHTISRRYAAVMHALRASTRSATGSEWRERKLPRGPGWRSDMASPPGGGAQALQLEFSLYVIKVLHLLGATLQGNTHAYLLLVWATIVM